jgi:UDP-N-acetylmuramoyl-tripeptide--D-alanyl-D-alanine ligase
MDLATAPSGARILNDAYNAGPASTVAALRALAALGADRSTAVLGVMAELGDDGPEAHRSVADQAAELGIRVIAVDAPDYGPTAEHVDTRDEALDRLRGSGGLGSGDAVLVKGSRVAALEQVAVGLLAR